MLEMILLSIIIVGVVINILCTIISIKEEPEPKYKSSDMDTGFFPAPPTQKELNKYKRQTNYMLLPRKETLGMSMSNYLDYKESLLKYILAQYKIDYFKLEVGVTNIHLKICALPIMDFYINTTDTDETEIKFEERVVQGLLITGYESYKRQGQSRDTKQTFKGGTREMNPFDKLRVHPER